MEGVKNIATGLYSETTIEEGFFILKFNNETTEVGLAKYEPRLPWGTPGKRRFILRP